MDARGVLRALVGLSEREQEWVINIYSLYFGVEEASSRPDMEFKPEKQKKASRKGQRPYTHDERQYLNSMFVRYEGYDKTIMAAAKKLDRTTGGIEKLWDLFVNNHEGWSAWLQKGKK